MTFPLAGLLLFQTLAAPPLIENPDSVRGGLVVSVDPIASRIGADVMGRGGNAVDATVATAFALAVTWPAAGNIGGGGFLLSYDAKSGDVLGVDFRETAPAASTPTMYLDAEGNLDRDKSRYGYLIVGVPGSVHGLWTAHQERGKLPWAELVEPAVRLAADGFLVDDVLASSLASQEADFRRFGEPARVYYPDGKPPKAGSTLKLPDLAATLARIRDKGADGFYRGKTAELLAEAMAANGGIITTDDLAGYRAQVRKPVRGKYRGYEIAGMPPPCSGGTVLIEMLHVLEGFDLAAIGPSDPYRYHLLAESMKRAYYDRAKYLGDPAFGDVPTERLTSPRHAAAWRAGIGERATPSESFGGDILSEPAESPSTTHFTIADPDGNVVTMTTTLEGSYGAKVIAPGTGFLLNNEMGDFNKQPGYTDTKGTIGTPANLIAPGKRMLSSQTPTLILKDGKVVLALGSPGGRTIINTVLQVTLNVLDHEMSPQEAVDAPRVHHQWMPDILRVEPTLPETVVDALRDRGHTVTVGGKQGDCHAIRIDPASGLRIPGVDRRRRGGAVGF